MDGRHLLGDEKESKERGQKRENDEVDDAVAFVESFTGSGIIKVDGMGD